MVGGETAGAARRPWVHGAAARGPDRPNQRTVIQASTHAMVAPAVNTIRISAACSQNTIRRAQPILNIVSISPRRSLSERRTTSAKSSPVATPTSSAWASKNRFTRKTRSSVSATTCCGTKSCTVAFGSW